MNTIKTVFVTGGAGYVGCVLVSRLLSEGYNVKLLDLYIYGDDVLSQHEDNPKLTQIKGDIRDRKLLKEHLPGCDSVIHLACISNDPSFGLNPDLGKSINYDAFMPLVDIAKESGVNRFIYASSSSVYGIKEEANVTEDLPLNPLTDYSKYKALCEEELFKRREPGFSCLIIRPATVCGYSPRLRLDLTVNILTNHAINNRKITVFGGMQKRPNIHIEDMVDIYSLALQKTPDELDNKIYNVGYENFTISEIANMVREVVDDKLEISTVSTDDKRSYHISSEKIRRDWAFVPKKSIKDAIRQLKNAFESNRIKNPMDNDRYYNIKQMKKIALM